MLLVFGNTASLGAITLPFMPGYSLGVAAQLPPAPPDVEAVLLRAHYQPGDPLISLVSWNLLIGAFRLANGSVVVEHPWLPVDSVDLFAELPPDRRAEYIQRFSQRLPRTGWLLTPTGAGSFPGLQKCEDLIAGAPPITITSGAFSLTYCRAPVPYTPAIARPRPIQSSDNRFFGSLDEVYFDDKPTFGTFNDVVMVARGRVLDARGWLVRVDAQPYGDRLEAFVDGKPAAALHYGASRPDVPAAMHAQQHAGDYSPNSGFTVAVPTDGLSFGAHSLTIVSTDGAGRQQPLDPAIPFSVY
jgi:hypothetical protein